MALGVPSHTGLWLLAAAQRFVSKVQETTRVLEKRMESTSRAAGPVFNAGSVSSLLRSFSKVRRW